jgi:hypothetical protein
MFRGSPSRMGIQPDGFPRGNRYEFENAAMVDLIAAAWRDA